MIIVIVAIITTDLCHAIVICVLYRGQCDVWAVVLIHYRRSFYTRWSTSFISVLSNVSLFTGRLPHSQTKAIVTTGLKKSDTDPDELQNYRPISNLTIERLVVDQMTQRLSDTVWCSSSSLPTVDITRLKRRSWKYCPTYFMRRTQVGDPVGCWLEHTINHEFIIQRLEISFGFSMQHYSGSHHSCQDESKPLRSVTVNATISSRRRSEHRLEHVFSTSCINYCSAVSQHKSLVGCRQHYMLPLDSSLVSIGTSLRDTVHRLPVTPLMAFNCVHGQGSGYFNDVVTPVLTIAARDQLWSADSGDVIIPGSHTTPLIWSAQLLLVSANPVWNELPSELKNSDISRQCCKLGLKTWLFDRAYS